MATWHKPADALLDSDVGALAGTVSRRVHCIEPGEELVAAMAAALSRCSRRSSLDQLDQL